MKSEVTVTARIEGIDLLRALTIACDALREVIESYPETNDVDTMIGRYDLGPDIARDAIDEIKGMVDEGTMGVVFP